MANKVRNHFLAILRTLKPELLQDDHKIPKDVTWAKVHVQPDTHSCGVHLSPLLDVRIVSPRPLLVSSLPSSSSELLPANLNRPWTVQIANLLSYTDSSFPVQYILFSRGVTLGRRRFSDCIINRFVSWISWQTKERILEEQFDLIDGSELGRSSNLVRSPCRGVTLGRRRFSDCIINRFVSWISWQTKERILEEQFDLIDGSELGRSSNLVRSPWFVGG
ncbi:hypothetical protein K1719_027742 [Acacia pycnantha]|nr:hypothetical protein K1719_027742 [Acacia pycnantha]